MSNKEEKGLKDNESSKFTAHYNYSYHLIYIPSVHIFSSQLCYSHANDH